MIVLRNQRHEAIINIINENNVETQQDLTARLSAVGFEVTQATVSRDIKELGLHKKLNKEGRNIYVSGAEKSQRDISDEMTIILSKSVVSMDFSLNTVVIKTLAGMAQGAASVLDAMRFPECLGTIAGDDTIFVITRSEDASEQLCKKLKTITD